MTAAGAMTAARWLAVVGLALGALGGPARADDGTDDDGDGAVVEHAQLVIAPGARPIGAVSVDNPLGDVTIVGYDGDSVSVETVKHAPDARTLERLRVTVVPAPDGAVRLSTAVLARGDRPPVALASVRIDVTVRVPHAVAVSGRVVAGRLAVSNLDAGAELDASAGPISVRNVAGAVSARSLAGSQRFEEVFGSLDSHAIDGDLAFDTVRGARLRAQAYAGRVDGRRVASREVVITTVDGDVALEATTQAGGRLSVASVRGDVAVTLAGEPQARVRVRAGGTLRAPGASPGEDGWSELGFGAQRQAAAVRVSSRFGDVSFGLLQ
jgi:hypothetical protein